MPILAAAVYFVLFDARVKFDQKTVSKTLGEITADTNSYVSKFGVNISFDYQSAEFDGWGYDEVAILKGMEITLSHNSGTHWVIIIPSLKVVPSHVLPGKVHITLAEALQLKKNNKSLGEIHLSQPIEYTYFNGIIKDVAIIEHVLQLPEQASFLPNDPDEKEAVLKTNHGFFQSKVWPKDSRHEWSVAANNIELSGLINAEELSLVYNGIMNDRAAADERYTLSLKSLAEIENNVDVNDLLLDFEYGKGEHNIEYRLNKLSITDDDYRVHASGEFNPDKGIKLTINNPKALTQGWLFAFLPKEAWKKVIRQGMASDSDASSLFFTYRKNNGWAAGDIKLEELAPSMLLDMVDIIFLAKINNK